MFLFIDEEIETELFPITSTTLYTDKQQSQNLVIFF